MTRSSKVVSLDIWVGKGAASKSAVMSGDTGSESRVGRVN